MKEQLNFFFTSYIAYASYPSTHTRKFYLNANIFCLYTCYFATTGKNLIKLRTYPHKNTQVLFHSFFPKGKSIICGKPLIYLKKPAKNNFLVSTHVANLQKPFENKNNSPALAFICLQQEILDFKMLEGYDYFIDPEEDEVFFAPLATNSQMEAIERRRRRKTMLYPNHQPYDAAPEEAENKENVSENIQGSPWKKSGKREVNLDSSFKETRRETSRYDLFDVDESVEEYPEVEYSKHNTTPCELNTSDDGAIDKLIDVSVCQLPPNIRKLRKTIIFDREVDDETPVVMPPCTSEETDCSSSEENYYEEQPKPAEIMEEEVSEDTNFSKNETEIAKIESQAAARLSENKYDSDEKMDHEGELKPEEIAEGSSFSKNETKLESQAVAHKSENKYDSAEKMDNEEQPKPDDILITEEEISEGTSFSKNETKIIEMESQAMAHLSENNHHSPEKMDNEEQLIPDDIIIIEEEISVGASFSKNEAKITQIESQAMALLPENNYGSAEKTDNEEKITEGMSYSKNETYPVEDTTEENEGTQGDFDDIKSLDGTEDDLDMDSLYKDCIVNESYVSWASVDVNTQLESLTSNLENLLFEENGTYLPFSY